VQSSPAVADGYLYAGSTYGDFYALNASTGAKIWNFPISTGGSSPAVAGNLVYVGSLDHNIYALNASTGTKIWNYTFSGVLPGGFDSSVYEVYSSPAVAYGLVYIVGGNALYAFGTSAPTPTPSPSTPLNASLSTLILLGAVVVVVILAVVFLVYRTRQKGAKSSPLA
jgi:outer membrane protein assembly factor BamB